MSWCSPLSAQVAADAVEGAADLATEGGHRADRGDGDESGDEAIFNCGSTVIIPDEFDQFAHVHSLASTT